MTDELGTPATRWGTGQRGRIVLATAWLALAVLGPWHVVANSRSGPVGAVVIGWGWSGWVVVAVALLVPLPMGLTALRCIVPLSLAVSAAAGSPWSGLVSALCLLCSLDSTLADQMVQGGAYGRETRFALRTPVPHMAPAVVAWLTLVGALVGGSLLVAAGSLLLGIPVLAAGLVLSTRTPRLLHRLSRRWLVVVPAGVVVHDSLVLAETFMVRSARLVAATVVRSAGEAADLTGGVPGERLLITMNDADKVVLSPLAARLLGTTEALHVRSFTVAPRRAHAAARMISPR